MAMKQNNFYLRWQKAAGAAKSESRSQGLRTLVPGLAVVAVSMLGWGVLTLHTSMLKSQREDILNWCSDNTDAINRTRIQYGTSFFYPVSAMGAHVSAVPNHQTGRVTSFHTRGVTAMAGTFGYELNPALLSDEEKQQIREQIKTYKKYETLINEGTYWRLSDPFMDEIAAWMTVSEEQDHALVSAVRLRAEANQAAVYVRLRGLKPDAVYLEEQSGRQYSGAALMHAGIPLPPFTGEYEAYQFAFTELKEAGRLYEKVQKLCDRNAEKRVVISIYGGSGSGKTTLATALQQYFLNDGTGCYLLSGDDYPHRIPKRNDEERLRVYKEAGKTDCVDISEQRKRLISPGSMKCLRHFMREKIRSHCGIWDGKMVRFHQKKPIFQEYLYCFWSGRTEAVTIYMVWIYPSFWKVPRRRQRSGASAETATRMPQARLSAVWWNWNRKNSKCSAKMQD